MPGGNGKISIILKVGLVALVAAFVAATNICVAQSDSTRDNVPRISAENFRIADVSRSTLDGTLPPLETKLNPSRAAIVGGAVATLFVGQHFLQLNSIWDEIDEFHFYEDGDYAFWADKTDHFGMGYYASYLMGEALMYSGFSYEDAITYGSLLGFGYLMYIEILDGYGVNWGFSWSDFALNAVGCWFYSLQRDIEYLQNFTPKMVYIPAEWHGGQTRLESVNFIDDYSSHNFFVSMNVHNMLPDGLSKYWPSWLEISVGYAVRNLRNAVDGECPSCASVGNGYQCGSPRYILALDYNLMKLLPDGGPVWNWSKQTLNYVKLPSPALEFGPRTQFHLMYPFSIQLIGIKF